MSPVFVRVRVIRLVARVGVLVVVIMSVPVFARGAPLAMRVERRGLSMGVRRIGGVRLLSMRGDRLPVVPVGVNRRHLSITMQVSVSLADLVGVIVGVGMTMRR